LITLGTSFGNDPNFFLAAAHAAVQIGCLPILVLGGQLTDDQVQTLRKRLPTKCIIKEHIDFPSVLPYLAAAIQHGGAGSTHALVTQAVPQIVVPHAADQAYQAQGVVRSGVGLHIPAKEVTIERLVHSLAQLLPDLSKMRENAQLLRTEFASLGGVSKASEILVETTRQ
jgi:UDP:flavonoid glycosyltransferase YjiC (YdhE family)